MRTHTQHDPRQNNNSSIRNKDPYKGRSTQATSHLSTPWCKGRKTPHLQGHHLSTQCKKEHVICRANLDETDKCKHNMSWTNKHHRNDSSINVNCILFNITQTFSISDLDHIDQTLTILTMWPWMVPTYLRGTRHIIAINQQSAYFSNPQNPVRFETMKKNSWYNDLFK